MTDIIIWKPCLKDVSLANEIELKQLGCLFNIDLKCSLFSVDYIF